MWRKVVLQVQHPEQSGLLEQRQAEHGPCSVMANIGIGGECALRRGIVLQDALVGAEDVTEHWVRQICAGHSPPGQSDRHVIAVARDCRFYPKPVTVWKNQQTSFGAGV